MSLKEKALRIKAIILDVDGVLTDARIGYSNSMDEIKFFNARDGLAIVMALHAGYKVGILSGRASEANRKRASDLKLSFIYEGISDKRHGFERLISEHNLKADECLFIGDDLIDIPVLRRAGISVAVNDSSPELDEFCDFRTVLPGGKGAVREVIVWLLKETEKWDYLLQKYLE